MLNYIYTHSTIHTPTSSHTPKPSHIHPYTLLRPESANSRYRPWKTWLKTPEHHIIGFCIQLNPDYVLQTLTMYVSVV